MATAMRMSIFLQRMLRKNDDEINEDIPTTSKTVTVSSGSKNSWIKKLGNRSPSKYNTAAGPLKTSSVDNLSGKRNRDCPASMIPGTIAVLPNPPLEMPDLESIIREFEKGFMSPAKNDASSATGNRGNFVKKIVAAFEVKYKEYNDLKAGAEAKQQSEQEENSRSHAEANQENQKFSWNVRRSQSKIFDSLKTLQENSKPGTPDGKKMQSADGKGLHKKLGMCLTPFKTDRETTKASGEKMFKMLLNPCKSKTSDSKKTEQKANSHSVNDDEDKEKFEKGSMTSSTPVKADFEDSEYIHERLEFYESPLNASRSTSKFNITWPYAPDESSLITDTSVTFTEELVAIDKMLDKKREAKRLDEAKKKVDSKMAEVVEEPAEKSSATKNKDAPRIVGAFLKKPIKVDDTAIDWIPITGERLPRKRSLKKLFSVLKSRRSVKRRNSVLCSREANVTEEHREFQDSGYDEKSSSSSSLTSLASINDILLQQEVTYVEPSRRSTTLKTFRGRNKQPILARESTKDKISTKRKDKLLLTEVPRDELAVNIEPDISFGKMSNRKAQPDTDSQTEENCSDNAVYVQPLPKHPAISSYPKLPKHPYISAQPRPSFTEVNEDSYVQVRLRQKNYPAEFPTMIRNSLYEVEFRQNLDGFSSLKPKSESSSSTESIYDVPRRFLSRSETSIADKNEPIYDLPKVQFLERPKSSIYEDAVSLRRRTACMTMSLVANEEPYYATTTCNSNKQVCRGQRVIDGVHPLEKWPSF